ncbi:MAG: hypothetical protein D8M58_03495 [Calditrichaeota bacterium]|nr:MAG: hypothetical protein DWQ03_03580 [Calditrichota bacterium]MBL1204431.1 hypothetical protein [Calditrichota bacterium]NOG44260.1 hypothetical protein [Calditrichota bacterium]
MFKLSIHLKELANRMSKIEWPTQNFDFDLNEDDLFNVNIGNRGENLFLGYYSLTGLKIILEKYKIIKKLNKLGFTDLSISIDTSDPFKHKVIIQNKTDKLVETLIELVVRRDFVKIDLPFKTALNGKKYECLIVEWLKMQNPRKDFTDNRPQLPGQDNPGLGIGSLALELLVMASKRLGLQGIINIPDHFHNAFFYSKIFYYENPLDQAKLLAIIKEKKNKKLHEMAWAIENGKLIDVDDGKIFKWDGKRQVLPLTKEWAQLYHSRPYKKSVENYLKKRKYKLI